jgi:hypothetical protein
MTHEFIYLIECCYPREIRMAPARKFGAHALQDEWKARNAEN